MLSLTSLTAPLAARTAFSSIGVNCRQGPHHGAQKSTRTGTSREASTTSRMKSLVVVFLMRSASAVAVPSERIGVSMLLLIHPRGSRPYTWQAARPSRPRALFYREDGPRMPVWQRLRQRSGERENERLVTAGADEAKEIVRGEPGRGGVLQRMEVDLGEGEEGGIDRHSDAALGIVDQGERRDRAWSHAEEFKQALRLAEAGASDPKALRHRLQIDARVVLCDDECGAAVFVHKEQVLGVSAWQALAQGLGLLDGEHRLVLHRDRRDAELFEPREQSPPIRHGRFWLHLLRAVQVPVCVLFRTREGQKR